MLRKGRLLGEILVINPNSSAAVSGSMERCLTVVADSTRHRIRCIELAKSPAGIESDADVAAVVPNIVEAMEQSQADAFVLACFSDPGLAEARAAFGQLVIGIGEAAYLAAMGLGRRFGILSLGPASIARHLRYLEDLGIASRLAGDRSIDMSVRQGIDDEALATLVRVGRALRDLDGADAVILGCAGLGGHRLALSRALGLPVVDPVQAGVAMAVTQLDLGYRTHP